LIINPLLLAAVYYILVTIIRRENDPAFFAHLTLGIFAFQLVGTSVTSGATSVTSSGKLVLNTPFPGYSFPYLQCVRHSFASCPPCLSTLSSMQSSCPTCGRPRCCYPCTFWRTGERGGGGNAVRGGGEEAHPLAASRRLASHSAAQGRASSLIDRG
jgi:hypothetical protein